MAVRGAPLIGATAAYGVALAMHEDPGDDSLERACEVLTATRPTAVNLRWALGEMRTLLDPLPPAERSRAAYAQAAEICDDDVEVNRRIGMNGLELVDAVWKKKQESAAKASGPAPERVNVLTHCNAGWLATVDWGTALSPVYMAHNQGIPVHVWVDETRPRNQGASLTCWELKEHGVSHTLVVDNVGGHLMQHGDVDLCIVGTDRTTASGDVCNKIGTYLKALAAHDNGVPFYVGLPGSTIDWTVRDGVREIPIEKRSGREITHLCGLAAPDRLEEVLLCPEETVAANYAFDVTPSRLVTGLITERGVCEPNRKGLASLFPEKAKG